MKIAVSATEPSPDAQVDPRFGRCQYFIVIDPDTMQYEAAENSGALAGGGAGISTAQMIAGKGVQAVLTGNCGPNAFQVLSAAGIKVVTGVSGKVQDAVRPLLLVVRHQTDVRGSAGPDPGINRSASRARGLWIGRHERKSSAGRLCKGTHVSE